MGCRQDLTEAPALPENPDFCSEFARGKVAPILPDELGYLPIDNRGVDLPFQVVAARYESGSIVIATP